MSRQTIGDNPLDALLTVAKEAEEKPRPEKKAPEKAKQPINGKAKEKASPLLKQRLTVQISEEIIERAKNAVYWTRGLTLAQLTEEALEKTIAALEKASVIYDDKTGKPLKEKGDSFPKRKDELKSGRPVK